MELIAGLVGLLVVAAVVVTFKLIERRRIDRRIMARISRE